MNAPLKLRGPFADASVMTEAEFTRAAMLMANRLKAQEQLAIQQAMLEANRAAQPKPYVYKPQPVRDMTMRMMPMQQQKGGLLFKPKAP